MSYADTSPNADCGAFTLHDRDICHLVAQAQKNCHPVPTKPGFDFYMHMEDAAHDR